MGDAEEALCPLSLSCPTSKEVPQLGTPESLLRPLTLPPGHCSPCSMQGRPWTGATLHLSPEQPHLSPVGVTFLQQRLRFTDKISRGFLSSLRPPSLCWGQVFRSLPAGATQRTKQGDQRSAVVRPLSCGLGLPSLRDVPSGTLHPTQGERGASQAVAVSSPAPVTAPLPWVSGSPVRTASIIHLCSQTL